MATDYRIPANKLVRPDKDRFLDEENPFEAMMSRFDKAAELLDLEPGLYKVHEVQPDGYLDGDEHVGTAGGVLSDDTVSDIHLVSATNGTGYDFCEVLPARREFEQLNGQLAAVRSVRAANRPKQQATSTSILRLTTGFSSGAPKRRNFISTLNAAPPRVSF